MAKKKREAVPSGINGLDPFIGGGFLKNGITIISAPAGEYKTRIAYQAAMLQAGYYGLSVGYASTHWIHCFPGPRSNVLHLHTLDTSTLLAFEGDCLWIDDAQVLHLEKHWTAARAYARIFADFARKNNCAVVLIMKQRESMQIRPVYLEQADLAINWKHAPSAAQVTSVELKIVKSRCTKPAEFNLSVYPTAAQYTWECTKV